LLLFPLVPPSSVGRLIIASLQIVIHLEESKLYAQNLINQPVNYCRNLETLP
jgi:hypothetical protein